MDAHACLSCICDSERPQAIYAPKGPPALLQVEPAYCRSVSLEFSESVGVLSAEAFWSILVYRLLSLGALNYIDWIATVGSATIDDFVGIAPCEVQLQASGEGPLI